jgi:hypothetical protein
MCIFAACSGEKGAEKQEKIIPVRVMEIALLSAEKQS